MSVNLEPAPKPRVTVLASAPKGDRLEAMIDGLSQVGASAYAPLASERTIVEPRQGKLDRLTRIAIESMKQCGRAWMLSAMTPKSPGIGATFFVGNTSTSCQVVDKW